MKPRHVKVRQREFDGPCDAASEADQNEANVEIDEAKQPEADLAQRGPSDVVVDDKLTSELERWKGNYSGRDETDEWLDGCSLDAVDDVKNWRRHGLQRQVDQTGDLRVEELDSLWN